MTIDDEKCRAILRAEKQSGRKVTITFNYRFAPPATAIRKIIADGAIGEVVTVDMHWPLDLIHGADYFRRWHRRRANTGGLQVHKSTHHFDLVNWIIQDEPVSVAAQGSLAFYGRNGPFRSRALPRLPASRAVPVLLGHHGAPGVLMKFYVAAEKETGYFRDGCVFDEEIDIEDNYSLLVNYRRGARLAYSLQAWSPWEGYRLEVQGKKGRLEYLEVHGPSGEWVEPRERRITVLLNDGSRTYMRAAESRRRARRRRRAAAQDDFRGGPCRPARAPGRVAGRGAQHPRRRGGHALDAEQRRVGEDRGFAEGEVSDVLSSSSSTSSSSNGRSYPPRTSTTTRTRTIAHAVQNSRYPMISFRPSTIWSSTSGETLVIRAPRRSVERVLIWLILTQDCFGKRLSASSRVRGKPARGAGSSAPRL